MENIRALQREPSAISFEKYEADLAKIEKAEISKLDSSHQFSSKTDFKTLDTTMNSNNRLGAMNNPLIKNIYQTGLNEDVSSIIGKNSDFKMNSSGTVISKEMNEVNSMLYVPLNLTKEQLLDRANCFEMFRKSYRKNEAMEENKEILKEKYARGKALGNTVNSARSKINELKNQIEELRKERALMGLVSGGDTGDSGGPEEQKLTSDIEKQKKIYKESFDELKELKAEIERIQLTLEKSREKMQKDFDKWLEVMLKQREIVAPLRISSELKALPKVTDKEVEKKLEAFYKARDEIYQKK